LKESFAIRPDVAQEERTMVVSTFLFGSFLGLILGVSSRYVGFGRKWARDLHPASRWLVLVLIFLWVAAPVIEMVSIVSVFGLREFVDFSVDDDTLQGIGIALGLLQGCIAFVIGWLAGPEADRAYRLRNPFQEDVPGRS
jgi:hypothetical protein